MPYLNEIRLIEKNIYEWHRDNTPEKYCVWFNYTKAEILQPSDSITLCTHGSIGYGKYVHDYARNWRSSISVALIIDEKAFKTLSAYTEMFHCEPVMKQFVTTHIVWKKNETNACDEQFITENINLSLQKPECIPHLLARLPSHELNIPYPPNTLRNIARHGASTKYHLIADIENQFSDLAAIHLNSITDKISEKAVVAIRRFEYDEAENPPQNLQILKEMLETKTAFEFHHFVAHRSHSINNLTQWLEYSRSPYSAVKIDVTKYTGSNWEPQLVVLATHPYHFEGAPIRYADQNMLPYEMCRARFTFAAVSHVYSFHKGIKHNNSNTDVIKKHDAILQGISATHKFHKYLRNFYPLTKAECGDWYDFYFYMSQYYKEEKLLKNSDMIANKKIKL